MTFKQWADWTEEMLRSGLDVEGTVAVYEDKPFRGNSERVWCCLTPTGFLFDAWIEAYLSRGRFRIKYKAVPLIAPLFSHNGKLRPGFEPDAVMEYSNIQELRGANIRNSATYVDYGDILRRQKYKTEEVRNLTSAILQEVVKTYFSHIHSLESFLEEVERVYNRGMEISARRKSEDRLDELLEEIDRFPEYFRNALLQAKESRRKRLEEEAQLRAARVAAGLPAENPYYYGNSIGYTYFYVCACLGRYDDALVWLAEKQFEYDCNRRETEGVPFFQYVAHQFPYGEELTAAVQNRDKAACDQILEKIYHENCELIYSTLNIRPPEDWRTVVL